ncbi:hypothetical protein CI109_103743 [Kwoniella shandongensis]|uniref:Uncharacterized protein n=1 Tax=Kwoniella shandongensis TaxID=1734106 RepID=A0A5M6C8Q1_9TREE|nr:uncharacterized protein CI109_000562 [Kwoniella shandongensis]KAA5530990.1 hypothetical protein CI109_000562 [Kwoniella shandongensis]
MSQPTLINTELSNESGIIKSGATTPIHTGTGLGDNEVDSTSASTVISNPDEIARDSEAVAGHDGPHTVHVSQRKKWSLLAIFSLALFIDQWSLAAFFVFTNPIVEDLNIDFAQQSWVITSYAVTFAASLLLWGRVSDLYSAKMVFCIGFATFGVLSVIISFLPEQYSFFIFRALQGLAGGTLVPSAFRLIVVVFEPHELGTAFTLYGVAAAIGATSGTIVSGVFALIERHDQMSSWRWFFRLMAVMTIPFAVGSLYWIPEEHGASADVSDKWKRLDLVGTFTMLAAIILLILSFTLGAASGFNKAGFLAPFLISLIILVPFFFYWESRLPSTHAILPPSVWKYRNFALWIAFGLYPQGWWSVQLLPLIEVLHDVRGDSYLIAAVRMLPIPITCFAATLVATRWPIITSNPRLTVGICIPFSIGALIMFAYSGHQNGKDYWKFLFTEFVFGDFAMMILYNANNVGVMTSVPPEMAGVAGALLQTAVQTGNAIALGVQSGLFTVHPGGIHDWRNVQASAYFEAGWAAVWMIGFIVLYKPKKREEEEAVEGEKRVAAV